MSIDIDIAKVLGWVLAALAGILMFFFKRELAGIDNGLTEINKKLEHTKDDMALSIQKIESEVAINKQNIALNSARDDEFKKLLDEKFNRIIAEIQDLKTKK